MASDRDEVADGVLRHGITDAFELPLSWILKCQVWLHRMKSTDAGKLAVRMPTSTDLEVRVIVRP